MRIKGQNWKLNRCCGRPRTFKTVSVEERVGVGSTVQVTKVAKVCQQCGKGFILTDAQVQADPDAQDMLGSRGRASVARQAHNLEAAGSIPAPATTEVGA